MLRVKSEYALCVVRRLGGSDKAMTTVVKNKLEDFKDELLTSLLQCGYLDLERLAEVFELAKKLGISIDYIIDSAYEVTGGAIEFNDIIYSAMRLTLDKIADEIENVEPEIAEKLRDWEVLTNYMDSWFNIEPLDNLGLKDVDQKTKEQIIKEVVEYVKNNS